MSTTTPTRRERIRADTEHEIRQAARRLLVAEGRTGIQLRSVARDVGMSAPALYRYYASLEALVLAVAQDCFDELNEALVEARDSLPATDPAGQLIEVSRAMRRWAVAHPAEFALIFGTPPSDPVRGPNSEDSPAGTDGRFGEVFAGLFLQLLDSGTVPVPDPADLAPGLLDSVGDYCGWLHDALGVQVPPAALAVFVQSWIRLYGCIALEVFGHLDWAVSEPEPLFEETLRGLSRLLGFSQRYASDVRVPDPSAP